MWSTCIWTQYWFSVSVIDTFHIHRFAIYIPLLLPISVLIVLSSIAALKWLASRLKSNGRVSGQTDASESTSGSAPSNSQDDSTAKKDKVK